MLQSLGFLVPLAWFNADWKACVAAAVFLNVRGMLQHDERGAALVGRHHLDHHQFFTGNYGQPWLDWLGGTALSPRALAETGSPLSGPHRPQASTEQETRCSESDE
jgi:sterol desaturase/sphingolipid hydroxylase (fatty acid hydroxylase superfamily)